MTTNQTMQRALRQLIANDAYAMTFQTMGQYRTALLQHVDGLLQAPATCSQVHPESALPPIADYDNTAQQYAALVAKAEAPACERCNSEYGFICDGKSGACGAQQAAAPDALAERDPKKPAEQKGLFRKFEVRRTDGSDQPGGKHHGCRYFVIDLDHDQHASATMRTYAAECATTHPQLGADIVAEFGPAPSAPGTPEAPKKPAHGHRDDYYLLANGRRLGLEPISRVRRMPNWVLAMELFATGSTSAHQICLDAGIDPESTTMQRAPQFVGGQGQEKES